MRRPRILLLSGDVAWHRGDLLIQYALAHLIRGAMPEAILHCAGTAEVPSHLMLPGSVREPSPLTLLRHPRKLSRMDAVIWGGGQLLQDNASLWKNPYWAVILAGMRTWVRGPLIGMGIGAGPLDTAWGRFFARRALRSLHALIVRDVTTRDLLMPLWPSHRSPIHIAPDPANFLPMDTSTPEADLFPNKGEEIRIGIAPRPLQPAQRNIWPTQPHSLAEKQPDDFNRLLFKERLQTALKKFARHRQIRTIFFPLYYAPWIRDDEESVQLAAGIPFPSHHMGADTPLPQLKAAASRCDLFISFRLHGAVLAMGAGVPTAGVSYSPKMRDYFHASEQGSACMTTSELHADNGCSRLTDILEQLWSNRQHVKAVLAQGNTRLQSEGKVYIDLFRKHVPAHSAQ